MSYSRADACDLVVYADSLEEAREKWEDGDYVEEPEGTVFQPVSKENGELPEELFSFQVFGTYDDAFNWLVQHNYDGDEFNIEEYPASDIEDATIIDEYGDEVQELSED